MDIYDPIALALGIEPIELIECTDDHVMIKNVGSNKPGYKLTEETKAKMRKPKGKPSHRKGKNLTESHKAKLRKPNTESHNTNISKAARQRVLSGKFVSPSKGGHMVETRLKIAAAHSITKTCPHCGKQGRGISMYKWHFSYCPKKLSD